MEFILIVQNKTSDGIRVSVFSYKVKAKLLVLLLFFFISSMISSQSVAEQTALPQVQLNEDSVSVSSEEQALLNKKPPALLNGVWQGEDRIVIFDSGFYDKSTGLVIPNIVLKPFYGYYADRAVESTSYTELNPKDLNDATSQKPQELKMNFTPLTSELYPKEYGTSVTLDNGDVITSADTASGAWDIEIKYPGIKEVCHVPIAVVGNKLYLNFFIKETEQEVIEGDFVEDGSDFVSDDPLSGYWQSYGNSSGLWISTPYSSSELFSYYITGTDVYKIRYWKTDMEYDKDTKAGFSDGGKTYYVPRQIKVGDIIYTCIKGKGKSIRNVEKSDTFPYEYTLNSVYVEKHTQVEDDFSKTYTIKTSTLCCIGKPYLTLVEGGVTLEDVIEEINSRKRPEEKPLYSPQGVLNFDWSIIEDLPSSYDRRMLDLGK